MSWFDVTTTQMPIFILFASDGVLFEGTFFPVSIIKQHLWFYSVHFSILSLKLEEHRLPQEAYKRVLLNILDDKDFRNQALRDIPGYIYS